MRLASINLCQPELCYTVRVRHAVNQQPTLLDWVLLQAVALAEKHPSIADASIKAVMEKDFGFLGAVEALILPTMLRLRDLETIDVPALSDTTRLEDLRCRDIRITERGESFRRDGVIRGAASEASLTISYQPLNGSIAVFSSNVRQAEPDTLPLATPECLDQTAFPEIAVRQFFEGQKKNRRKAVFSWLKPQSIIESIEPVSQEIRWLPVKRELLWEKDGIRIPRTDAEVAGRALASMPWAKNPSALGNPTDGQWPLLNDLDPDTTLREIWPETADNRTAQPMAGYFLHSSRILILRDADYEALPEAARESGPTCLVLTGAAEDRIKHTSDGKTMLYTEERCLPDDVFLMSDTAIIRRGRTILQAGGVARELAFFYQPKIQEDLFMQICRKLGQKPLFAGCIQKLFQPVRTKSKKKAAKKRKSTQQRRSA